MKRYIAMSIFVLFAQCGLYTGPVFGAPVKIVPTTEGENSIVDAVKYYSNITESDVSKYKLLALGSVGTFGAFVLGAASTVGAGVKVYQKAGIVQGVTPERVPGWMTNALVLAGLGSTGAGYVSYKMLYPRIREGVLDKVQSFIDVCQGIHEDSPADTTSIKYSIVNWSFNNLQLFQSYLPCSWPEGDDVATYNALYNLAQQARRAQLLLNQIGSDEDEIIQKRNLIKFYSTNLLNNTKLYASIISTENQKKREAAELAGIEAGTSLIRAKTIETYGSMLTSTIKNMRDTFNYLYDHKGTITTALTTIGAVSLMSYVKGKLGYGQ